MKLPFEMSRQIAEAIRALDRERGIPDRVGIEHEAIPLYADLGGAVLLREDGTLLELEWDQESERNPRVLDEPPLKDGFPFTAVLVAGMDRYPWLSSLLPARTPAAIDCATCRGSGRVQPSNVAVDGGMLCGECGALGWRAA
jgi:hypothetical protein